MTFDVKDVVISIAAMFFGPVTGIIISVIVPLSEMFTVSDTGPYGFIMNALASLAFVLPVSVVYKYKKVFPRQSQVFRHLFFNDRDNASRKSDNYSALLRNRRG